MKTFVTFTNGKLDHDGEIVSTFDDAQELKELNRHDFSARFTFTVYDHNGDYMQAFDCHLDSEDGGWVCSDSEFSDTTMIYVEIAEQAQCDFTETGNQAGIYHTPNFECDCDAVGSLYAWTMSAE